MITLQSAMLVALGFSLAGVLVCVIAPAYKRRAQRLATQALKRAMPLSEAEIAADKDRLRASLAIRIHNLETKLADAELEAARQLIEINRRDATISSLERDVARLATANEEHENARRVLELTIAERLPKVEQRLAEAKRLLFERDREIAALTQTAQKQSQALDEATQINTQQRDEIHRLNATLNSRAVRNRDQPADRRYEAEVALRTELEALRARVRDQAQLIARLKQDSKDTIVEISEQPAGADATEIARLRQSLAEAERALQAAGGESEAARTLEQERQAELRRLQTKIQDQAAEIARLSAALAALEGAKSSEETERRSARDLTAKVRSLEAEAAELKSTIQGLRAEVVAANEKLARQAAHHMEEMRRLGVGTRPAAGTSRAAAIAQPSLSRPSLSERISAPRVATVAITTTSNSGTANGASSPQSVVEPTSAADSAGGNAAVEASASGASPADTPDAGDSSRRRRPGLLQRITGLEKPVA